MSILFDQIEKAKVRSSGLDLRELVEYARLKPPSALATPVEVAERREFVRESLGDTPESERLFERIIDGNELQDVNFLARGARAAKAVARVAIRDTAGRLRGWGTGFLIAPSVLLTNNHVLPDEDTARRSDLNFEFEIDIDGAPLNQVTHALAPDRLFFTSRELDFTVVGVQPLPQNGDHPLSQYGFIPLVSRVGKVAEGEWLTIVQHPNGERKQVCVRENKLLKRADDVLWYSTDTLGGSSGSPVFNNDWYVVALHHSGVPEEKNGRIQTTDGRDFDSKRDQEGNVKWIANEGIRVSRIVDTLRQALPAHPMLQPVYGATPENARLLPSRMSMLASTAKHAPAGVSLPIAQQPRPTFNQDAIMTIRTDPRTEQSINVTLNIDSAGTVSVVQSGLATEAARTSYYEVRPKPAKTLSMDVDFNARYDDRKGFNPAFLDDSQPKKCVYLPKLSDALEAAATPLLKPQPNNDYVLHYHNFSVVMHRHRRFAIYTAANVDFGGRFDLARPGDVWRQDPRIPADAQVSNFYYAHNQFDRGHLTRREDLEFGDDYLGALVSAADTCHWTNCTPQHANFNQNRELWQGIERHLLEDSIFTNAFRAQVFTGPILDDEDPIWEKFPKIQYPVRYWKVVAAINSAGDLFGTAFLLDQSEVVSRDGIERAGVVPFGPYKHYQVPISDIERLTGLAFMCGAPSEEAGLSRFDPLRANATRRGAARRRTPQFEEMAAFSGLSDYVPLDALESIITSA